jgi:hypothetical protein
MPAPITATSQRSFWNSGFAFGATSISIHKDVLGIPSPFTTSPLTCRTTFSSFVNVAAALREDCRLPNALTAGRLMHYLINVGYRTQEPTRRFTRSKTSKFINAYFGTPRPVRVLLA